MPPAKTGKKKKEKKVFQRENMDSWSEFYTLERKSSVFAGLRDHLRPQQVLPGHPQD